MKKMFIAWCMLAGSFITIHCGNDMLDPYKPISEYRISQDPDLQTINQKNAMIKDVITGTADPKLYDEAKAIADRHFFLFVHNDTTFNFTQQEHLHMYKKNFFNECIIAACQGRSDLLLAMPKKPWTSSYISPILKSSKNKLYLSDIMNLPLPDTLTGDTLLHLVVRAATHHNENRKYAFKATEREFSTNLYPKLKQTVEFLVNHKANINVQNIEGDTALHIACKGDDPEMNRLLLKLGANPNIANKRGNTPIKYINKDSKTAPKFFSDFQAAQEKGLWKKKLTKKEAAREQAEKAEFNEIAQAELKQKTTAPNSTQTTPEKKKNNKIAVETQNSTDSQEQLSTDRTASISDSAPRQIKKHVIEQASFGSTGDYRPGFNEIKEPLKIRSSIKARPATAGTSRPKSVKISHVIPDKGNPLIIDNTTMQYSQSTTTTDITPLKSAMKQPKGDIPSEMLNTQAAINNRAKPRPASATSRTDRYSETRSTTKIYTGI